MQLLIFLLHSPLQHDMKDSMQQHFSSNPFSINRLLPGNGTVQGNGGTGDHKPGQELSAYDYGGGGGGSSSSSAAAAAVSASSFEHHHAASAASAVSSMYYPPPLYPVHPAVSSVHTNL